MHYLFRILLLVISFVIFPESITAQYNLKSDIHCLDRTKLESGNFTLDELFPSQFFDLELIESEVAQSSDPKYYLHFLEPGIKNAYKPNSWCYDAYQLYLEDPSKTYGSLSNFEASVVLNADLVIKGKIIAKDNYSDTCIYYRSTYHVLILEEYKDNFNFHVGDTIILKSVVGFEGGCAWLPGLEKGFISYNHYETDLEIDDAQMFALSALWYYKVVAKAAMGGSDTMDEICLKYFVDPGFNLKNASNKTGDIIQLLNSVE